MLSARLLASRTKIKRAFTFYHRYCDLDIDVAVLPRCPRPNVDFCEVADGRVSAEIVQARKSMILSPSDSEIISRSLARLYSQQGQRVSRANRRTFFPDLEILTAISKPLGTRVFFIKDSLVLGLNAQSVAGRGCGQFVHVTKPV